MSEKSKKVMMINVTHAEESRVAIVSGGVLEAFEIETFDHKAQKGNIYKGRIESVQPGLQAAFVDIGGTRGGFLPLDEVNFKVHTPRKEGNRGRIENHLHKGQELLVQVVRDAYGTKPPTLSTYFSLPGRFLVLTPYAESTGISRKLDDKQRERLRKALDSLPVPENHGVIVRTAGAAATKTELARDLKYLLRVWENIETAAQSVRSPKLIYQERSLVIRTIRDLLTPDIDEILVDDQAAAEEIIEFFDAVLPQKKTAVKLYQGDRPIFNKFNLEEQIENIFRRRVPLPSGGAIVFDATEALTAVDVNSGKMTHEGHIEDTALKANLEAAAEIARQMRLRDLGGLVVIDFIDMRASKNIRQVEKAMKDALKKDKARYDVTRISSLGLLEISRERLAAGKSSLRYTDCPTCDGTGSIKTVEAACLQALRRLQTAVVRGDLENIELMLPPEVAEYLLNQKRQELVGWEDRYKTQIIVKADPSFTRDRCEVRTVVRERPRAAAPLVVMPSATEIMAAVEADEAAEQQRAAAAAAAAAAKAAANAAAGSETDGDGEGEGEGTKKRRRRRGGRKHRRDGATSAASGDLTAANQDEVADGLGDELHAGFDEAAEAAAAGFLKRAGAAAVALPMDDGDATDDGTPEGADDDASQGAGASATAPSEGGRKRRRRRRRRKGGMAAAGAAAGNGSGEGEFGLPPVEGTPGGDEDALHAAPTAAARSEAGERRPREAAGGNGGATALPVAPVAPLAAILAEVPGPGGIGPRPQWWVAMIGSDASTADGAGGDEPRRRPAAATAGRPTAAATGPAAGDAAPSWTAGDDSPDETAGMQSESPGGDGLQAVDPEDQPIG